MRWRLVMLQLATVIMLVEGRETAFLEIIIYEMDQDNGRYTTHKTDITGKFSHAGSSNAAEGDIVQMHPVGICDGDKSDDEKLGYGWVGFVKLAYSPADSCQSLVDKAQRAVDKGATAVIFDISDHPGALLQLSTAARNVLNRPVVLVQGDEAAELIKFVNSKQVARARIQRSPSEENGPSKHFFDVGVVMTCGILVFIGCLIVVAKVKCWRRQRQITIQDLALQALQRMKTRKYSRQRKPDYTEGKRNSSDSSEKMSFSSSASVCAICLEEFCEGQELRVIPCQHEFHKQCVDPWLKQKWTCPLCNRNILADISALYQQEAENGAAGNPPTHPQREERPFLSQVGTQYAEAPLSRISPTALSARSSHSNRSHTCGNTVSNEAASSLFHQRLHAEHSGFYSCDPGRAACIGHHLQLDLTGGRGRAVANSEVSGVLFPSGGSTCGSDRLYNLDSQSTRTLCSNNNHIANYETISEERTAKVHMARSRQTCAPNAGSVNLLCRPKQRGSSDHIDPHGARSGVARLPGNSNRTEGTELQSAPTRHSQHGCFGKMHDRTSLHFMPHGVKQTNALFSDFACLAHASRPLSACSGYVPDSSDGSDSNSGPFDGGDCKHESFSCLNANAAAICQICRQRLNTLHNSSTHCMYGSVTTGQNCSLFSLASPLAPNRPPENASSGSQTSIQQDGNTPGLVISWPARKVDMRSSTPYIGYSSSDGVDDMGRLSNSSLEAVLEAIGSGSVTFSC